jgi:hypothetical protein
MPQLDEQVNCCFKDQFVGLNYSYERSLAYTAKNLLPCLHYTPRFLLLLPFSVIFKKDDTVGNFGM